MALPRRPFLESMTPEILSDLRAAARHLMRQICEHEPEDCECTLNMYTPMEFVDWLDDEAAKERGKPVRFESGYRPRRKDDEPPQWNLARAAG